MSELLSRAHPRKSGDISPSTRCPLLVRRRTHLEEIDGDTMRFDLGGLRRDRGDHGEGGGYDAAKRATVARVRNTRVAGEVARGGSPPAREPLMRCGGVGRRRSPSGKVRLLME